jgi:penicillin-binding protein 2
MGPNSKKRVRTSIRVLQFFMLGMGLIVIGRIYQLQILEYETYSPLSRENTLRQEYVHPARGLIYDRHGNLLVDNEPIYTITITPSNFDTTNTRLLAKLVDMPVSQMEEKIEAARAYSWHRSSRLLTEVNFDVFSHIQENIWRLPGVGHLIESKRNYPMPIKASHVLGYLREVTEQEYHNSNAYRLGDKAGRSGLELVYEQTLRGEKGIEYLQVNALGQSVGSFDNGELDEPPTKGVDLITTLDTELQMVTEELMKNKLGGAVAMDPRDGSILAMVSSPQYEVRRLAGRLDSDYWKAINADTTKPLFNRAITTIQPPGSTFKPIMALVGLEMGLITPETVVQCNGGYRRGRLYKCTKAHGPQKLEQAIQNSCNTYFFSLMNKIADAGQLNEWNRLVEQFGLGHTNGIDLPYESRGIIPDSTYLNRVFGERKWGVGDIINLGVGQGLVSASPLQMALVAAQIANGGYNIKPHLVQALQRPNGGIDRIPVQKSPITWLDSTSLMHVQSGMRKVVTDGSGRWYANLEDVPTAGKTGTAQNPHGMDHAWFISYAPIDDPQIAVAVLVENAGFGSLSAAPIASLMIEKYLTGEIERQWIYNKMLNFEPRQEDEDETDE